VFSLRVYLLALELPTVKPADNFVAEKCGESWMRGELAMGLFVFRKFRRQVLALENI